MIDAQVEYILHYSHGGHTWATSFFAVDDADAERKVESVRETLQLKGRLLCAGETLEAAAEGAAQAAVDGLLRRLRR